MEDMHEHSLLCNRVTFQQPWTAVALQNARKQYFCGVLLQCLQACLNASDDTVELMPFDGAGACIKVKQCTQESSHVKNFIHELRPSPAP